MYTFCLSCASHLGRNDAIELFPVGERLAFDSVKGRLWVLCPRCHRWNLSPIEERWEAMEACERLFRNTRLRYSTDNIGLAQDASGLELVRIGSPSRSEFAAWRYGRRLYQRWRSNMIGSYLALPIFPLTLFAVMHHPVASLFTGTAGLLGLCGWFMFRDERKAIQRHRMNHPHLRLESGHWAEADVQNASLVVDGTSGWCLDVPYARAGTAEKGRITVRGEGASAVAGKFLTFLNQDLFDRKAIRHAVCELERVRTPEHYFSLADARARVLSRGYYYPKDDRRLSRMHPVVQLALEMAANEATERCALEGELKWLEQAWREAEEVAAIADRLVTPPESETRLNEIRARAH